MKKQLFLLVAIVVAACTTSCSANRSNEPAGYLTTSLDPEAWNSSVWISAPDAPVVTEKITGKRRMAPAYLSANCRMATRWFRPGG